MYISWYVCFTSSSRKNYKHMLDASKWYPCWRVFISICNFEMCQEKKTSEQRGRKDSQWSKCGKMSMVESWWWIRVFGIKFLELFCTLESVSIKCWGDSSWNKNSLRWPNSKEIFKNEVQCLPWCWATLAWDAVSLGMISLNSIQLKRWKLTLWWMGTHSIMRSPLNLNDKRSRCQVCTHHRSAAVTR